MSAASSLRNHYRWFADQVARLGGTTRDPQLRVAVTQALDHARKKSEQPFEREPASSMEASEQEQYAMIIASAHQEAASPVPPALHAAPEPDPTLHWYEWPLEVLLRHFHRHSLPDAQALGDFDARWLEAIEKRLTVPRAEFPKSLDAALPPRKLPRGARIAIAGDWGTGLPESDLIAANMKRLEPDVTIHLGDVYYAGYPPESQRFVERWPDGKGPQTAYTLNSNHEMYSGGVGYFGTTLRSEKFSAQSNLSCFALESEHHVIVGLDSAFYARQFLYGRGALADETNTSQHAFLRDVVKLAGARTLIVLTHHDGLALDGTPHPLFAEVKAIVNRPFTWIWGHVHAGIAFQDRADGVRARCVGHGGVPYLPFSSAEAASYAWAETKLAGDAREPERALNGFYVLSLDDGPGFTETFYDERGARRWMSVSPSPATSRSSG